MNYVEKDDNWQKGDAFLEQYFLNKPEAKHKLLHTPYELLNAADLYALASLIQCQGDEILSAKISDMAYKKAYTKEYQQALENQLGYMENALKSCDGFAVDIASGTGTLVDRLLKNTELDIVFSDISYHIMKKAQSNIRSEYVNRILYIAFDVNNIPF